VAPVPGLENGGTRAFLEYEGAAPRTTPCAQSSGSSSIPDELREQLGHGCALGHACERAKAFLELYRGVAERRSQQVMSAKEPDRRIESALPLAHG
jgi:hypothetical protein